MEVYGEDNEQRMSGEHETASYDKFSVGIANRGRSVRIGNDTLTEKKGYFEGKWGRPCFYPQQKCLNTTIICIFYCPNNGIWSAFLIQVDQFIYTNVDLFPFSWVNFILGMRIFPILLPGKCYKRRFLLSRYKSRLAIFP